MRELKFRAWTGEKMINNVVPFQWDFVLSRMSYKCTESNGPGFLGSGGTEAKFEVPGYSFKEVMQFTGLRGKNGEDIFEGDVLSFAGNITADNSMGLEPNGFIYDENSKHEVIWDFEIAAWAPKFYADAEGKYKRDTRGLMLTGNCEVIGNIYQNPGLIDYGN